MDGYNFSGGMFQNLKEGVIVWISTGIAIYGWNVTESNSQQSSKLL